MTTAVPPPTLDLATGPGEPEDHRPRRVAPWVAAGAAVAVTALIAGGLAVGGRGPLAGIVGSGPAVLHIGTGFAGGGADDVVADPKGLRAGRYVLTGSLPGSPASGTAWWLRDGSIDERQVTALAAALGMSGAAQEHGADWVVRDGTAVLRVYGQPGLPFAFDASPDDNSCPSMPTDGYGGPDTAVGCVMTAPAPTTAPPPAPDEATLNDLARSVAAALGAEADRTVWRGAPYGSVLLDPTVDGLATSGAGLSIQATTAGVTAASGWLGGFVHSGQDRGDTYPLRSAQDVFGDLASMPQPAIACAESMDGDPMCGGDVTVTGASYGLVLAFDDGRPVLVPAWLFAVQGSDTPMAQVAVQSRYLDDPAGSGSGSAGGTSGSTGGGVDPAPPTRSTGPSDIDPAVPVTNPAAPQDPSAPGAEPASPAGAAATVSWTGPRALTLVLTGGCELETAAASIKATPEALVVTYAYDLVGCTTLEGRVRRLPLTLDEDPAGRPVVDQSGVPIPVVDDGLE